MSAPWERVTEAVVDKAALDCLAKTSYTIGYGPDIGPEGQSAERDGYRDVVLLWPHRESLARTNPDLPEQAVQEATRRVRQTVRPRLVENSRRFHRLFTDGVDVECRGAPVRIRHEKAWLVDAGQPLMGHRPQGARLAYDCLTTFETLARGIHQALSNLLVSLPVRLANPGFLDTPRHTG